MKRTLSIVILASAALFLGACATKNSDCCGSGGSCCAKSACCGTCGGSHKH